MEKVKCVIIDDEKLARDLVKNYLQDVSEIDVVEECKNGFEGIKAIQTHQPDLVFLDIQMPKINGFEMLELVENPPCIIFTTAFDQYALKAFEVCAVDYLLKPFAKERFNEAVKKSLSKIYQNVEMKKPIEKLQARVDEKEEYLNRVVVKEKNKISVIPVQNIIYFEAQDDYVQIVAEQSKHLKQKTMKYYETHLDPTLYIRIHRSYILNINYLQDIELMEKESYRAILKNGMKLPVSRSGYSLLKNTL
jgi:two-component system LytT family response regulator